jgi:ABC-2 type transport system permease protein
MTRTTVALARRALRNALRRPQFLAPMLIFPSLFLAVNVGGLSHSTQLPGFPHVHGFLDFQLAAALTQSLLLSGVTTGIATALEIEGGFFDRLIAAPISRVAIVLGRLAAGAVIAAVQATYFIVLGLIFGAHFEGGALGALSLLVLAMLAGIGFGAVGQTLAFRAGNASTVQGVFPLVFVVLFVSTAFYPEKLLGSPIDAVAKYNPLSYIADGMRDPIISSASAQPILEGLAAAVGIVLVFGALSLLSLRTRLRDA